MHWSRIAMTAALALAATGCGGGDRRSTVDSGVRADGCVPRCAEDRCGGDDGCGGTCPETCGAGEVCDPSGNRCCAPRTCEDLRRSCGVWSASCGVTVDCGECGAGEACMDGRCQCAPDCSSKACGVDPVCGERCGTCFLGDACEDGRCVAHATVEAASLAGGDGQSTPYGLVSTTDGAYFVSGSYVGNAGTFGDGETTEATLATSSAFVAAYDADGGFRWVLPVAGAMYRAELASVVLDAGGTALYAAGSLDVRTIGRARPILVRVDPATGAEVWRLVGSDAGHGYAIAVLDDGDLLFTGDFGTTLTFHPGETYEVSLEPVGSSDVFVARVSPEGQVRWARAWGGATAEASALAAAVGPDGDAWIAGFFSGTVDLGGLAISSAGTEAEVFVARVDPSGAARWAATGPGIEAALSTGGSRLRWRPGLAVRGDGTAALAVGQVQMGTFTSSDGGTVPLEDPGLAIVQLSPSGVIDWLARVRGGPEAEAHGVLLNEDGSVAVAGSAEGTIFGPGEEGETLVSGRQTPFLASFRSDGSFEWVHLPAQRVSTSASDRGWAVAPGLGGTLLLAGEITGPRTLFGAGQPGEWLFESDLDGIPSFFFVARVAR